MTINKYQKNALRNNTTNKGCLRKEKNMITNILERMFKKELILNKIWSFIMIGIGILSIFIENDVTFFVFSLFFSVPLFFAKKNYILMEEKDDELR